MADWGRVEGGGVRRMVDGFVGGYLGDQGW